MKKLLGLVMVLGLVLVLGRVAMAADTNTVTVTANVLGTCRFASPTSTLAFGALDPGSGNPVNAATTTTFWCTSGTLYTIADNDGLHELVADQNRMRHATDLAQFIPYTFSYNPAGGSGSGPGTPITLNISGAVAFASYQNALPGDYSDTVVLSITP